MGKYLRLILVLILLSSFVRLDAQDLDLAGGIQQLEGANVFKDPEYFNWGASIINGEDGQYHMFYSRWKREYTFSGWLTFSEIARATSTSPEGPWEYKETVLKGRGGDSWDAITAHNPKIKFFDGKYYLYYIATHFSGKEYSDQDLIATHGKSLEDDNRRLLRENQRTGVAVSESLNGPWIRCDEPIIEPSGPITTLTVNPAITKGPDEKYYLIVKGDKPNEARFIRNQAIAISTSPQGPFEMQPSPVIGNMDTEDASLWYDDKDSQFYAVYHAHDHIGLITSKDGLSWEKAQNNKVLDKRLPLIDGSEILPDRMERPFVFVENGKPRVLALTVKKGEDSYTVTVPIMANPKRRNYEESFAEFISKFWSDSNFKRERISQVLTMKISNGSMQVRKEDVDIEYFTTSDNLPEGNPKHVTMITTQGNFTSIQKGDTSIVNHFTLKGNAWYLSEVAITLPYNEELKSDLEFLVENIKTYNPALYLYNPDFDEEVSKVMEKARGELTDFQKFQLVSEICALSNEGHFSLGNWEDKVHKGFSSNEFRYLPLAAKILKNKIYLTGDYSNEQLTKEGDELVSINAQTIEEILNTLYSRMPADGEIVTYVNRTVELGFAWWYYINIEQPEVFELKIRSGETIKDISIKALLREEQVENYKKYVTPEPSTNEETGFYELEYTDDYALLTLSSFDWRKVDKYEVKPKSMYKLLFEELDQKNVSNLIIDLRNNTGGRSNFADGIIPFVIKKESDHSYWKKTISWEGKEKTYKVPKPGKSTFKGEIYILVNGRTYSAGHSIARYLKEYGEATVIGEESGTRYEGFVAGSSTYIDLPYSGFRIGIPRYHILYPKSSLQTTSNRGLLPDHLIEPTISDVLEGKDLHLEKAKELISASKN